MLTVVKGCLKGCLKDIFKKYIWSISDGVWNIVNGLLKVTKKVSYGI